MSEESALKVYNEDKHDSYFSSQGLADRVHGVCKQCFQLYNSTPSAAITPI